MNKYSIAFIFILCIGMASAYETILDDRGLNTTGNVTADWLKGKINWSYIQNFPGSTANINLSNWSSYQAVSNINMNLFGLYNVGDTNISGDLIMKGGDHIFEFGSEFQWKALSGLVTGQINFFGTAFRFLASNGANLAFDADNDTSIYFNSLRTTADIYMDWSSGNSFHINGENGNIGINITNSNESLTVGGTLKSNNYKSSDGSLGITNSSLYLCKDSNCTNKCNVQIKNGLIVGCT